MGHPPCRAQCRVGKNGMDHLVGMQASLHERFHFSVCGQLCCPQRSGVAVRYRFNGDARQVDTCLFSQLAQLGLGPDQHGVDQAMPGRVDGAPQGIDVTGMHDAAAYGRQAIAQAEQRTEARLGIEELDLGHIDTRATHPLGRRQHAGHAVQHPLATLIEHLAVQLDALLGIVFGRHHDGDRQRVADANRLAEMQCLLQINGARAWEDGSEQGRDQRTSPHSVGNHPMEQRRVRVGGVQMRRIGVPRNSGKGMDIFQRKRSHNAGGLADLYLVVSNVVGIFLRGKGIHGNFQRLSLRD